MRYFRIEERWFNLTRFKEIIFDDDFRTICFVTDSDIREEVIFTEESYSKTKTRLIGILEK